tara:strand:+ start:274 stop:432 length:159 start_codon:yes stop_codon:yes gene_type:complete
VLDAPIVVLLIKLATVGVADLLAFAVAMLAFVLLPVVVILIVVSANGIVLLR